MTRLYSHGAHTVRVGDTAGLTTGVDARQVTAVSGSVLVVDDEPGIRAHLKRLLQQEGIDVVTAPDAEVALTVIRERPPDVILLDVMMPRLSGLEFCKHLKSTPTTRLIPVVLVTGLGAPEDRIAGIEAGADDFISKPFDHVELLARVRSLMRVKAYTDELERAESVLFVLARALEGRDPYTEGHCERLADYAARLGRRFALPEAEITALRRAGIVHDIGKIVIPDAILLKPGALTREEWEVMKQHPVVGERICRPLKSFSLVLPIIRHHHEKQDGSGYPDGLAGDAVPFTARVLQVVDVFDALTTERPYKRAVSAEEAMDTLREEVARGWWDPGVVEAFGALEAESRRSGR